MSTVALAGIACMALCSLAGENTATFSWERVDLPSGRVAVDLYVDLTHPASRVTTVYGVQIHTTAPGGFHQSAEFPFWQAGVQHAATTDDSFVTIGTHPNGSGNTSATIVVPAGFGNFNDEEGAVDYSYIGEPDADAGWHIPAANPIWGYPIAGRLLLARLVVEGATECDSINASFGAVWRPGGQTVGLEFLVVDVALPLGAERDCRDCGGDLDGSGAVDGQDLGELLSGWGRNGTGDLNGDGEVNGEDLGILLSAWGSCP